VLLEAVQDHAPAEGKTRGRIAIHQVGAQRSNTRASLGLEIADGRQAVVAARMPRRSARLRMLRPSRPTSSSRHSAAWMMGPATALALRKGDIDAVVYEARTTSAEGLGSFLTLPDNGVDALRTLEADRPFVATGFPANAIVLWSGTGKRLGSAWVSMTLPKGATGFTLKRGDLYAAMHHQAAQRGILRGPRQSGRLRARRRRRGRAGHVPHDLRQPRVLRLRAGARRRGLVVCQHSATPRPAI
jgi:hypothetical protein